MTLINGRELRERMDGFTDAYIQTILDRATDNTTPSVYATGIVETASSIVGRAFASASVSGGSELIRAAITPAFLRDVGRALMRAGDTVFLIDTSGGRVEFIQAYSWDVTGGARVRSWRYRVDLPSPSGNETVRMASGGVLHFRYATNPQRPWDGQSPLDSANIAAKMNANINNALANESGTAHGYILPNADEPADEEGNVQGVWQKVLNNLKRLRGRLFVAESQFSYVNQTETSPQGDWEFKRMGAAYPAQLIEAMKYSDIQTAGVLGVPAELISGISAGGAGREAYRRMLHTLIAPLGKIVEMELSEKLETSISLEWDELRAGDISGKARAFGSLVQAGMSHADAAANTGLMMTSAPAALPSPGTGEDATE